MAVGFGVEIRGSNLGSRQFLLQEIIKFRLGAQPLDPLLGQELKNIKRVYTPVRASAPYSLSKNIMDSASNSNAAAAAVTGE
ncbi:hypothetical protein R6Q57_024717 [Mikania cordata]